MAMTNAERQKRYRERHPDRVRASIYRYRLKNPNVQRLASKRYKEKYPERIKESSHKYELEKRDKEKHSRQYKKRRYEYKYECFKYYSNETMKCARCGIGIFDVLTIDHINGGGRKMAREIGIGDGKGGHRLYIYLVKNNFPDGFRVLCFNCQHLEAKRLDLFNVSKNKKREKG
jgi:hypothetical protein